jgi:hypothetical protein
MQSQVQHRKSVTFRSAVSRIGAHQFAKNMMVKTRPRKHDKNVLRVIATIVSKHGHDIRGPQSY